jgi:F-box/leucine-rich repeat protein 4
MLSETDTSLTEEDESTDVEDVEFAVLDRFIQQAPGTSNINGQPRKEACVIINQFVSDVIDFSSQYGSDFSISYTAFNITGKPSKYPDYGDFPETFAFVSNHTLGEKSYKFN